jgi:hypothetical protein
MSNEDRQRILREAGHRPAEAEKETDAQDSKEALGRKEAERAAEQADTPGDPTPAAEQEPDRPRPRR